MIRTIAYCVAVAMLCSCSKPTAEQIPVEGRAEKASSKLDETKALGKSMLIEDEEALKKYPVLGGELIVGSVESGEPVAFRAIVESHPGWNLDENKPVTEFRLFIPNSPRRGGVMWDGCPVSLVKELLRKNPDGSVWVILRGRMVPFGAFYQTNPEGDPGAVVEDCELLGYYYGEKHVFPPNVPLPEK